MIEFIMCVTLITCDMYTNSELFCVVVGIIEYPRLPSIPTMFVLETINDP